LIVLDLDDGDLMSLFLLVFVGWLFRFISLFLLQLCSLFLLQLCSLLFLVIRREEQNGSLAEEQEVGMGGFVVME